MAKRTSKVDPKAAAKAAAKDEPEAEVAAESQDAADSTATDVGAAAEPVNHETTEPMTLEKAMEEQSGELSGDARDALGGPSPNNQKK